MGPNLSDIARVKLGHPGCSVMSPSSTCSKSLFKSTAPENAVDETEESDTESANLGEPSGSDSLSSSKNLSAAPACLALLDRRVDVGVGDVGILVSKPSDLRRASISFAMPTVSASLDDSKTSAESDTGVDGRLSAPGRARRDLRPTLSPLRSFSSRLSKAAVSSKLSVVADSCPR